MTTPDAARWQRAAARAQRAGIAVRHLGGEMWHADSATISGRRYIVLVKDGVPVDCQCAGGYGGRICQHKAAVFTELQREAGWDAYAAGMVGV